MQSAVFLPLDGDNVLRTGLEAAVTAAANTDHAVLPFIQQGAYWQGTTVQNGSLDIAINVSGIGTGDGTLEFQIVACDDAAKTNPVVVEKHEVAGLGPMIIEINEFGLKQAAPTKKFWFLRAVTAHTTGTNAAVWSASIAPDID